MMNCLSILFLCLLWNYSAVAKVPFYENNRIYSELEQVCEDSNAVDAALVMTPYFWKRLSNCKNNSCQSQLRFKYQTTGVELKYLEKDDSYSGKYFRILEGDSENLSPRSCGNIRASNVYYHLNEIHDFFKENFLSVVPQEVQDQLNSKFPIDARVNIDSSYSFLRKFGDAKVYNDNRSICGHLEKDGNGKNYLLKKPEIWFFSPFWEKGKFSWAPLCQLDYFRNHYPCTDKLDGGAIDSAMIPDSVIHEYFHLWTDSSLVECKGTPLGEAYSIFISVILNANLETATGLPYGITHREYQVSFSEKIKRYNEEVEVFHQNYITERGAFIHSVLYKLYQDVRKELIDDDLKAAVWVWKSVYALSKVKTQGQDSKVVDLPKAFEYQCKIDYKNPNHCLSIVTSWKQKYF